MPTGQSETGSQPRYSFRDLVALRVMHTLLSAGVPTARARLAVTAVRDAGLDLSGLRIVTDGRQVWASYLLSEDGRTADVRAAESDVSRRKSNLETRAAVITAREATAKSRQANVERLKELQEFKHILAPFDGIVTSRTAEIGMLVTAGKEALFTIEDMSRVRVQVHVPQAYAAQTLPGTAASVIIPEEANKPVAGKITRIAEGVDATNRTMLAEVELENPSRRFQPGSYAKVALTTSADSSTWTIPTNTLQMRIEGPHVAVVDEHQMVELRPVQLGRDLGRRVIVVAGIAGDERLVVNPGDDLTTGTSVQTAGAAKHQSVAMRSNSAEVTE